MIVAALSTPAIDWLPVQRALAPEMPVVPYDRGGLGWSDPGRGPRTVARMAEELHAFRADQPAAPNLGVLLVVYGYFAFTLSRYTGGMGKVSGTSLVTPSF